MLPVQLEQIAQNVINKLGLRRAREAGKFHKSPKPSKTGFEGVDIVNNRYRARIRFCDALSGQDVRITLGYFNTAEDAGYAYATAHISLYGAASRYSGALGSEVLDFLLGSKKDGRSS